MRLKRTSSVHAKIIMFSFQLSFDVILAELSVASSYQKKTANMRLSTNGQKFLALVRVWDEEEGHYQRQFRYLPIHRPRRRRVRTDAVLTGTEEVLGPIPEEPDSGDSIAPREGSEETE